jgi:3-deoxy-manno-octulosonate cytidylyltransferase (CMP-KDO synthetase)
VTEHGAAFRVLIPARYASTRLPGKPLLRIGDKPLIQHVWERAQESGCTEAIVATDDARIVQTVESFGARAVLTSPSHTSGTERLAEVALKLGYADDDIVVNLQGDEPFLPGVLVRKLAAALDEYPHCGIATLATPIREARDVFNPNVVKVVTARDGRALYFSRAPIPWQRGAYEFGTVPQTLPAEARPLRHIGLYAYRVRTLREIAGAPPAELEQAEALEQLRAMYMGIAIHVSLVAEAPAHGVDTAEDLQAAEREYAARMRETIG